VRSCQADQRCNNYSIGNGIFADDSNNGCAKFIELGGRHAS